MFVDVVLIIALVKEFVRKILVLFCIPILELNAVNRYDINSKNRVYCVLNYVGGSS